jgi:hypothetical protein
LVKGLAIGNVLSNIKTIICLGNAQKTNGRFAFDKLRLKSSSYLMLSLSKHPFILEPFLAKNIGTNNVDIEMKEEYLSRFC